MNNYKRILSLILAVLLCIASVSCGSDKTEILTDENTVIEDEQTEIEKNFPNVSLALNDIIEQIKNNKLTAEDFWDNYISDKTKELDFITRDMFIENMSDNLKHDTYVSHKIEKIEILSDNIAQAKYKIIYRTPYGVEEEITYKDYFIKENGSWRVLLLGITEYDYYVSEGEDDEIKITDAKVFKGVNGIQVDFTLSNRTDSEYSLGNNEPSSCELTTENKSHEIVFDKVINISAHSSIKLSCFFRSATGDVKNIQLENVFELDDNGNIKATDEGSTLKKAFKDKEIVNKPVENA